ncbi:hypothetical protein ACFE04_011740 [Oxalis oulophora]
MDWEEYVSEIASDIMKEQSPARFCTAADVNPHMFVYGDDTYGIHDEGDDDNDEFPKQRKMDIGVSAIIPVVKPIREPRVVQTKVVKRAPHDPKSVITTYEGKHNHEVPTTKTSSHDTSGAIAVNSPRELSKMRSGENDTMSLNLGVGIIPAADNRDNDQQQALCFSKHGRPQTYLNDSDFKVLCATPMYG